MYKGNEFMVELIFNKFNPKQIIDRLECWLFSSLILTSSISNKSSKSATIIYSVGSKIDIEFAPYFYIDIIPVFFAELEIGPTITEHNIKSFVSYGDDGSKYVERSYDNTTKTYTLIYYINDVAKWKSIYDKDGDVIDQIEIYDDLIDDVFTNDSVKLNKHKNSCVIQ